MKFFRKPLVIKIIRLLKNKYVVALLVFSTWIIFLDENNLVQHRRNKQRLAALKEQKDIYRKKIAEDMRKIEELRSGLENLEKFAREQYHMSKPDEDVFIVVEK